MKKGCTILSFILLNLYVSMLCAQTINLKVLQTSDIHGNYFPYDFIEDKPSSGSLSRISSYLKQEREKYGERLLLLDNGDILQGQPTAYYYNFMDTIPHHLCARIMNYLGYNAATMGNHDIETGPAVYDRIVRESRFPWLAANAIREGSEKSYFSPYMIYEVEGIRIGVLGMITPAIPTWLPKSLWQEMYFKEVKSLSEQYVSLLREKERVDVLIGLMHLGADSRIVANEINEGGGEYFAYNIPGFDILMLGHDHRPINKKIANIVGDSVVIINPGANGNYLSEVQLQLIRKGERWETTASATLVDVNAYEPDPVFLSDFQDDYDRVYAFVHEEIAYSTDSLRSRDAYFGPSSFVDLIHRVQLDLTQADISLAAPLSFDTQIKKGPIFVSDMFKLYKFENFLYTMSLTGQEVKDFLEYSYDIWINRMHSPDDHLLKITYNEKSGHYRFINPSYNFDSAAGISYTVDVSQPYGGRIRISSPFDYNKEYKVAINSYRGNGGGGHLTEGSGIPLDRLDQRILSSTPVDLRYYLMEWMKVRKVIKPEIISDWKFIPETWTLPAAQKDYQWLFSL